MNKMSRFIVCLGLVSFLLNGCGSSLEVIKPVETGSIPKGSPKSFVLGSIHAGSQSDIPEDILKMVDNSVREEMRRGNLTVNPGNLSVEIELTGYRQRGAFTRIFWGVFAGSDWIEARVRVQDEKSHQVISEASLRSSNATTADFNLVAALFGQKVAEYLTTL